MIAVAPEGDVRPDRVDAHLASLVALRAETHDGAARAHGERGGLRSVLGRLGAWIDALDPARGVAALVVLAVLVWVLQSVAWPVVAGRDLGTYLRYYAQMWEWDAVFPQAMLGRTPGTPLVVGLTLELGRIAVELLMASLFVASIVAWTLAAASLDRRAAALVAAVLLLYPGYGALFHQFSSDALAAAGFAFWSLAAVRVALRPSAVRFALLGAGLVALVLVRPGSQVLLVFGLAPLVLGGGVRSRVARVGAYVGAAGLLLVAWSAHNAVRYDDFTVARGANIVVPFSRAFTEERIVAPANGEASRRLARAVETELLVEEPYRSYGIDVDEFFASGSTRMVEDLASLSDRTFGWDTSYEVLREAGLEAVRRHPGAYAEGVAVTMWRLLRGPAYVVPPGRAAPGSPAREEPDSIIVTGRDLPRPSDGDLIPGSHQGLWVSTPDNRIREVWTSPTEHHLEFRRPGDEARAREVGDEIGRLLERLPDRDGNATLAHRLNQAAYRFPPPIVWLVVGVIALAWRRPLHGRVALLLTGAALLVLLVSALGLPATAEYAMPVVPAFALLAGVGLLAPRRSPDRAPPAR